MKNVTVSVVMPAFNAERFVREAIASVQKQSRDDWELIVIDDCSQDATRVVLQELAEKDDRIRLFTNERNLGVAKTRNRGFEKCRGKYVALLDSDDLWFPQKLEKQIALAESSDADLVYCSYAMIDEMGDSKFNDYIVPETTDYNAMLAESVISCSTALIKREVLDIYKFPTTMYHEDYAFWLQLLRDEKKAVGSKEVLASYRILSGSRSSDKLRSAIRRWKVYRQFLRLSFFKSVHAMVQYVYCAMLKYRA